MVDIASMVASHCMCTNLVNIAVAGTVVTTGVRGRLGRWKVSAAAWWHRLPSTGAESMDVTSEPRLLTGLAAPLPPGN